MTIATAGLLVIAVALGVLYGRGEMPTRGNPDVEDTPEIEKFERRMRGEDTETERAEMAVI